MSERKVGTISTTPGMAASSSRCASASTSAAQALVDAIAELDDEGGVAAGQEAGLRAGWHGLNNRHRIGLGWRERARRGVVRSSYR